MPLSYENGEVRRTLDHVVIKCAKLPFLLITLCVLNFETNTLIYWQMAELFNEDSCYILWLVRSIGAVSYTQARVGNARIWLIFYDYVIFVCDKTLPIAPLDPRDWDRVYKIHSMKYCFLVYWQNATEYFYLEQKKTGYSCILQATRCAFAVNRNMCKIVLD